MFDTIIIGGGPAGIAAAIYAARKKLKTLLISPDIGGQILETWEIENYPGLDHETGATLAKKFEEHLAKFKIEVLQEKVTKIKSEGKSEFIIKTSQKTFQSKTIILAMGKKPRRLNVPGEKEFRNRGVSYCATCDGPLFQDKIIAVVGGGNAGLETAIEMDKIARKVCVIELNPKCLGDPLLIDKVKASKRTEILTNSQIQKIYGDKMVQGIKVKNSKTNAIKDIKLDGVFVEIGSIPNTKIVKGLVEFDKNGKIKIDTFCRTNTKGVFACGDITDVAYEQIVIAAGEGAKAAISAFNYLAKER